MAEPPDRDDPNRESGDATPADPAAKDPAIARLEVQLQRAMADLANLRKRMLKDADDARRRAIEGLAAELLPVLDNFHLALGARTSSEPGGAAGPSDAIADGVRMVRSMLEGVLERHGLAEIPSLQCEFDPNLHEAVGVDATSEVPPGRIVRVMARGYYLGERVLRPSRVIVSGATDGASRQGGPDADDRA
ncbi:MAG: nucleotide exchange factor GrpE [Planctomycetes bacterium]|nr:nucleotide exchange factor GrpE [Planctomycetota bacterium]